MGTLKADLLLWSTFLLLPAAGSAQDEELQEGGDGGKVAPSRLLRAGLDAQPSRGRDAPHLRDDGETLRGELPC